eukprot:gnl/TRDRNA2_/TRDRNA2_81732_c0_seq1.p1 gnl/TRDRNA2_/TRDRNA2_81732_c0~~gnl/TRDRNA2_/TRDRNA2_81732_c0_seq1.p1  ORF type:complete len:369 (+),score=71.28 gnl/TRDRNA2_/TRDRNA2_81732_c0_seq1:64-1170(+)
MQRSCLVLAEPLFQESAFHRWRKGRKRVVFCSLLVGLIVAALLMLLQSAHVMGWDHLASEEQLMLTAVLFCCNRHACDDSSAVPTIAAARRLTIPPSLARHDHLLDVENNLIEKFKKLLIDESKAEEERMDKEEEELLRKLENSTVYPEVAQQPQKDEEEEEVEAPPRDAHGFRDDSLIKKLEALDIHLINDPIERKKAAVAFEGHSTQSLFVHDKQDEGKRYLITLRHDCKIDLKQLAGIVGCAELGPCPEAQTLLGSQDGCITPLSLAYDVDEKVDWVVDGTLLVNESEVLRFRTSAEGFQPTTVAEVPVFLLKDLLSWNGHWDSKKVVEEGLCRVQNANVAGRSKRSQGERTGRKYGSHRKKPEG